MRRARRFGKLKKFAKGLVRRIGGGHQGPEANRGYLICSSPRSGSTYLCELLASTGVLGIPREYFNVAAAWGKLDPNRPADLRPLLDRILTKGATPNGIYGFKCHADHFSAVSAVIAPLRALPELRFIRIRRRDLLGQAISWSRADQTGQFRATHRLRRPPAYDAADIRRHLGLVAEQQAAWDRFFRSIGRRPLEVEYEEILRNPQPVVDRIARLMEVPLPVPTVPTQVTLAVQRDDLNLAWRQRFLEETGEEFRHLAVLIMPPFARGSASAS